MMTRLFFEFMKMAVFWVVAPCSLIVNHQGDLIALMMEAGSTSETSVNFYQTTRRSHRPDDEGSKHL
jgi:hypothetical protein